MPLKNAVFVLFAVWMGIVAAGCGTEVVHIGPMPGGDGDLAPDGDSADVVLPDGDRDDDPDVSDGIELPDSMDLLDMPDSPDRPDSDDDADDRDFPWEQDTLDEDYIRDYEYLDSGFAELAAPECVEEPELPESDGAEHSPVLVFDEPVLVNSFDYGTDTLEHTRVVDCGNGVILALWEDSRCPVMYALSKDNGETWTDNRELPGLPQDVDDELIKLHDLAVSESAAVVFITVQGTGYFIRLPLPVTNFARPHWETEIQTSVIFYRPGVQYGFAAGSMAVTDDGHIMVYVKKSGSGLVEHHAVAADWGASPFGIIHHEPSWFCALPDNRFLQVAKPATGNGVQHRIIDPNDVTSAGAWTQQDLAIEEITSVQRSGVHVALLATGSNHEITKRSDYNMGSHSFGEPSEMYRRYINMCVPVAGPDMHLNRDGRISYLFSCSDSLTGRNKLIFGYQETPLHSTNFIEFFTESPNVNPTATASLLLESGKKLGFVTSRLVLQDRSYADDIWWQPEEYYNLRVYSHHISGSGVPQPPEMLSIGIINDGMNRVRHEAVAKLGGLPGGDVGVVMQGKGESVAIWANTLQQARAGEHARWLYNLPELYGNNDYALSPVEPVWIDEMMEMITWDGRPCMVTWPDINASNGGDSRETRCMALSCYGSWASVMAGERPGPLEMMVCDPFLQKYPSSYLSGSSDIWYGFVEPGPLGKGFAMITLTNENYQRGILFYDESTGQWPYVQFSPEMGWIGEMARLDEHTMIGTAQEGIMYSYNEGQSWSSPMFFPDSGDFFISARVPLRRSNGSFCLVVGMTNQYNYSRGKISALTYDCEAQELRLLDMPDLDGAPNGVRAVALDYGDIAVLYTPDDMHALYALILNPDTGYRSEPVTIYSYYDSQCKISLEDVIYQDGVLSVAYGKNGYCGGGGDTLYITQARIAYE